MPTDHAQVRKHAFIEPMKDVHLPVNSSHVKVPEVHWARVVKAQQFLYPTTHKGVAYVVSRPVAFDFLAGMTRSSLTVFSTSPEQSFVHASRGIVRHFNHSATMPLICRLNSLMSLHSPCSRSIFREVSLLEGLKERQSTPPLHFCWPNFVQIHSVNGLMKGSMWKMMSKGVASM